MLDAMHASSDCAPFASHLPCTQTWTAGVMVAQLMKSLPFARLNNPPV